MTDEQWKNFCNFREEFYEYVNSIKNKYPQLKELQMEAAKIAKTPDYNFENPIVYNQALNEIQKSDEIKLIVIGDNPGKNEQLSCNCRYLVGQAGKIAEGWFKKNPDFNIDFRKNVIILNKTPIHSAKTTQLNTISKLGGKEISDLIEQSQIWMAEHTAKLHMELYKNSLPELWLVGYAELKGKGIFTKYKEKLFDCYKNSEIAASKTTPISTAWNSVYVFQHFSMNRFSIDFNEFINNSSSTNKSPDNQNSSSAGKNSSSTGHNSSSASKNFSSAALLQNQNELWNKLHKLGEFHKTEIFS